MINVSLCVFLWNWIILGPGRTEPGSTHVQSPENRKRGQKTYRSQTTKRARNTLLKAWHKGIMNSSQLVLCKTAWRLRQENMSAIESRGHMGSHIIQETKSSQGLLDVRKALSSVMWPLVSYSCSRETVSCPLPSWVTLIKSVVTKQNENKTKK